MTSAIQIVSSFADGKTDSAVTNSATTVETADAANSKKRGLEDSDIETQQPITTRPRQSSISSTNKETKSVANGKKHKERLGDIMYPRSEYGPYGYDPEKGRFPFDRINTLGYLLNPIRRPTVIEKWSPYEVAVFEAALTLHGKNFHQVQKFVKTKTVKEVIEFYYDWKKTSHYKQWKDSYKPDERETE